jgi:alkylation response protein AidB-like acyl-CoA dehydrogenase
MEDAWSLNGHKSYVVDATLADLIVVIAQTNEGPAMFAVDSSSSGLHRKALPTFDPTRRMGRIEFLGTPARLIGRAGGGAGILSAALDRAAILLAAEMVGGAEACLDMSVDYAKQRHAFGRPIGSFQAIKHKCADVLTDIEGARSAAHYAAWAVDSNPAEVPEAACVAKAAASEAFFRAAGENVQIHGAIGTTWEHDAHLYLKRAKTSVILLGDANYYRRQLADRIGL